MAAVALGPTETAPTANSDLHELTGNHQTLAGSVVEINATAKDRSNAERAEQVVGVEIARLEPLFSAIDDTSMLNRWITDPSTDTSNEFDELLSMALGWQRCSRGAFNVSTRRLQKLWAGAAVDGCRPSAGELHELAAAIAEAPYRFDGHILRQIGDCSDVDLDAIAQGFILDLALETAWRLCDLDSLTVAVGADIAHRGSTPVQVEIDDPFELCNEALTPNPVDVQNAAVATSGLARSGVQVGNQSAGDRVDPRTGQLASGCASATVVAPSATSAGVVAKIVGTMKPGEALAFVETLNPSRTGGHPAESFSDVNPGPIRCWIIDRHGKLHYTGREGVCSG